MSKEIPELPEWLEVPGSYKCFQNGQLYEIGATAFLPVEKKWKVFFRLEAGHTDMRVFQRRLSCLLDDMAKFFEFPGRELAIKRVPRRTITNIPVAERVMN